MWATARRGWGVLALALVAMAASGVGADTAVEIGHSGERDNFPADVFGRAPNRAGFAGACCAFPKFDTLFYL